MNSNNYTLRKTTTDDAWDSFVRSSPNGTLFSYGEYLKSIRAKIAVYYLLKSEEIKAAIAVVENEDQRATVLHDFIIYNGIMFAPPQSKQNRSSILSEQFRTLTEAVHALAATYGAVSLSLAPSIIDIRPFLWHNYGTDKPKFASDIRYTSQVNISDFRTARTLEDISIYHEASYSRRQEIRYAIRDGVVTKADFDARQFVDFYVKTMSRQDIQVDNKYAAELETLITNLYDKNLGKMFVSYTASGDAGSMAFYGFDNKRAYYLFGANEPSLRDSHTGTAILWDSFYSLSREGIEEVDLEGVNSPHRGWFKLSFGGNIIPYYQLALEK